MSRPRQHTTPVIWDVTAATARRLEPLALASPAFPEATLQSLLAEHPTLIPIEEIEPWFGPLVCLGREVAIDGNYIDLLYASPRGDVTIVETKLWKNPGALRVVVGQLLDYGTRIASWRFDDLDAAVRSVGGGGVIEKLRAADPDLDEAAVCDNITSSLRRGRILMLIVGDGIRQGVEDIARCLRNVGNLALGIGLVEIAPYRDGEDPRRLYLQPRVVARPALIQHAVVKVELAADAPISVQVQPPREPSMDSGGGTLTEAAFFDRLARATSEAVAGRVRALLEDCRSRGLSVQWRNAAVSVRFEDPSPDVAREYTGFVIKQSGTFQLGWLSSLSRDGRYPEDLWRTYQHEVSAATGAVAHSDGTRIAPVTALLDHAEVVLASLETMQRHMADRTAG